MKFSRLGAALVLILVPLLLLALVLPPERGAEAVAKRNFVVKAAAVMTVAAALACAIPTPLFPRGKKSLAIVLLGTALLVFAAGGWNVLFHKYVASHTYRREVFRKAMRNFHAPMYGRYDNALARTDDDKPASPVDYSTLPWAIAAAGFAGAWFVWAWRRGVEKPWDARSLAVLISFQLGMIALFALCEPWPTRFSNDISGYGEFRKDIAAFAGVGDTLRSYVARMPTLEWYGQHYPPGNLLLLTIEQSLGLTGLTRAIVCLLTVLSTVPLYRLARELDLDHAATSSVLLLYSASAGVLIYCTINTTSMLLFPATLCLWMLVRGLKTGSTGAAVVLGLSFAFYLFFSFSASILGVLMALATMLGWWRGAFPMRNILRIGAISIACVFAAIILLFVTTRFNLIACFAAAVQGHQAQQGNEGFDDVRRYLLRSSGNVIAYLMSTVPLCVLALCAMPSGRPLFTALGLTLLIAGFSGLFYVETERIWIFLTPCIALAAGFEVARRAQVEGRRLIYQILLLTLLVSLSQEFFFQHYR